MDGRRKKKEINRDRNGAPLDAEFFSFEEGAIFSGGTVSLCCIVCFSFGHKHCPPPSHFPLFAGGPGFILLSGTQLFLLILKKTSSSCLLMCFHCYRDEDLRIIFECYCLVIPPSLLPPTRHCILHFLSHHHHTLHPKQIQRYF
jgi:hypothetical protein